MKRLVQSLHQFISVIQRRYRVAIFAGFLLCTVGAVVTAYAGGRFIPGSSQNVYNNNGVSPESIDPSNKDLALDEGSSRQAQAGIIQKKPYQNTQSYVGTIGAQKETQLAAKTSGRVALLNYEIGDEVGHGYLVARLSGDELYAQLTMAEHSHNSTQAQFDKTQDLLNQQVDSANAQIDTSNASIEVLRTQRRNLDETGAKQIAAAQKSVEVAKTAYESASSGEKEVKQKQYEQAQEELKVLEESIRAQKKTLDAQIKVAEEQVDQSKEGKKTAERSKASTLETIAGQRQYAKDNVALAQIAVNNTKVNAPYYGIVVAKHAEIGDVVGAGQPIVTIANTEFRVKVEVPDTEVDRVALNQIAEITVDGLEGTHVGKITRIHPSVDPQSRTFLIELTFAQVPPNLKYGQSARISLFLDESSTYFVNRSYVIPSYDGSYVILEDGRKTFVQTGVEQGDEIEIYYPGIKEGVQLQRKRES